MGEVNNRIQNNKRKIIIGIVVAGFVVSLMMEQVIPAVILGLIVSWFLISKTYDSMLGERLEWKQYLDTYVNHVLNILY